MTRYHRTKDEVLTEVQDQVKALSLACDQYDSGFGFSAKSMASIIYVLLQEGGNSRSLLKQYGIRTKLRYLTTAIDFEIKNKDGTITYSSSNCALAGYEIDQTDDSVSVKWAPHLSSALRKDYVSFDKWWDEPVCRRVAPGTSLLDGKRTFLSRKRLIFHVRSQDGGAHYDKALSNDDYIELRNTNQSYLFLDNPDVEYCTDTQTGHTASIRQMSFELLETFRQFPEIFPEKYN